MGNQDEMSRQIANIKNLKMVNIYHLFGEDAPVLGILAYYQDKTINLCNADPHFQELFDKLVEVYAKESEDTYAEIIADEETQRILNLACGFPTDEYEKRLAKYEEVKAPLFLPRAFSHAYVMPIVKFICEALYRQKQETIRFEETVRQWFGQGMLDVVVMDRPMQLSFMIHETTEDTYEVTIRNVLKLGNLLKLTIRFGDRGVSASYSDIMFGFQGELLLHITEGQVTVSHLLKELGEIVETYEKGCELAEGFDPTERTKELMGAENMEWKSYRLPWGDMVLQGRQDGELCQVYASRDRGVDVSRGTCFRDLIREDGDQARFGVLAFRLYEREDVTEVHLLDLGYPGNAIWREKYSGKCFDLKR